MDLKGLNSGGGSDYTKLEIETDGNESVVSNSQQQQTNQKIGEKNQKGLTVSKENINASLQNLHEAVEKNKDPNKEPVSFNYGRNAPPGYKEKAAELNGSEPGTISSDKQVPTSEKLYKSVVYIKETTSGSYRMLKRVATLFFCSLTITVILIILMAIPVTMIVTGGYFIDECPVEKMIPIWLIVFGGLAIVKNLSTLFQRIKSIKQSSDKVVTNGGHSSSGSSSSSPSSNITSTLLSVFDSFLTLFLFIWFICGNIWVYSNYKVQQWQDRENQETYCNGLCYLYAFVSITSIYALIWLACFIFCCTVCCTIFVPTKQ
jgi:hypothetical protein